MSSTTPGQHPTHHHQQQQFGSEREEGSHHDDEGINAMGSRSDVRGHRFGSGNLGIG